jgi:Tfp pilus assembly protein PilO
MPPGWRANYARYKDFFLNVWAVYRRRQDLKVFMELIFSLATISVFAVFALKPTLITITQLIKDNQTKREAIATMDTKIKNLGIAQGLLSSQASQISLIESAVPSAPLPEAFARQIEGLTQVRSTSLMGISIGEVTLKGKETPKQKKQEFAPLPSEAKELDFSISVSGSYSNLSSFLSDLENLRRPRKIDTTNFNVSVSETGQNLVLVISGRTPYLGQDSGNK